MSSPTQRSLKKLRDEGYVCHIVEKFNRFSMRRVDCFGFGDILAIRSGEIVLVQTTSGSNLSARKAKIESLSTYKQWYDANGIVVLHGWRKLKTGWACRELKTRRKYTLA